MNLLAPLIADMRQKRLWPLAALLVVLVVALPILLSDSATPVKLAALPASATPAGTGSAATSPAASVPAIPAIAEQVSPVRSRLRGKPHDPFNQGTKPTSTPAAKRAGASAAAVTTTAAATATRSTAATTAAAAPAPAAATTTTTTTTTVATPSTTPIVPLKRATPASPPGLANSEVYAVAFSITNATGGFDTVTSLRRLTVLPSERKPLLVELGVLEGGRRVLFAVQSGASTEGPGRCIPGPADCAVLSMAPGQIEKLSGMTAGGAVYAEFSITGIHKRKLATPAAAGAERREVSDAGRHLLHSASAAVLSLFSYQPRLGVLVDERNLAIGGN